MFSEPRSVHNLGIHTTLYTFSDTDTEIFKHSLARSEPFFRRSWACFLVERPQLLD